MKKLITLIAFCITAFSAASAQETTPTVINKFIELFGKKDYTGIYELCTDDFKKGRPADAITSFLNAVGEGVGENPKFKLNEQDGAKYDYIISGDKRAARAELYVTGDKLSGIRISPHNGEVSAAPVINISTSNKMATAQDRLVDSAVRKFFTINNVGLAVAVIKNGQVSYYGYGETYKGSGAIPTQKDIFEVGSITKTFTATILANLVKEGKIDLNKDFRTYLPRLFPGFKQGANSITVQQLANHTSGLPSMPAFSTTEAKPGEDKYNYFTKANLENYIKNNIAVDSAKAKTISYSNLGFGILGYIIEQVTGSTYNEQVNKYILKPLSLNNTWVNTTTKPVTTKGYNNGQEAPYLRLQGLASAGMIKSNLVDLVTYAKANMKRQGVWGLTQKPTFSNQPREVGLSWFTITERNSGKKITYHNGGTTGYRSFLGFDPQTQTGVIILSNSTTGDPTSLGLNLLGKL